MALNKTFVVSMLAASLAMVGCGSDDDETEKTALFKLKVTDAPVDGATQVVVAFDGVELKPASGDTISFDYGSSRQINLLQLQGDSSAELLDESIPAGEYNWIRLKVSALDNTNDSYIVLEDGTQYSLSIPSGNQSGLKLNRGFVAAQGGVVDFTIDFDLRKSVTNPVGQEDYKLRPTLRIVNNLEVGHINGSIAASIVDDAACTGAAVYVYPASTNAPDDEGSNNAPLASSGVALDESQTNYQYEVGFLEAGDYDVALTCSADRDDPESDDDIEFIEVKTATVNVNEKTQIDFE